MLLRSSEPPASASGEAAPQARRLAPSPPPQADTPPGRSLQAEGSHKDRRSGPWGPDKWGPEPKAGAVALGGSSPAANRTVDLNQARTHFPGPLQQPRQIEDRLPS